MKRTELVRRTPLASTSEKARLRHNLLRRTREAVKRRSGGLCEAHLAGCGGRGDHVHHLRRRSQGGTDHVSNLLHVCASCHRQIHDNPVRSFELGLLVRASGFVRVVRPPFDFEEETA